MFEKILSFCGGCMIMFSPISMNKSMYNLKRGFDPKPILTEQQASSYADIVLSKICPDIFYDGFFLGSTNYAKQINKIVFNNSWKVCYFLLPKKPDAFGKVVALADGGASIEFDARTGKILEFNPRD